MRRRRHVKAKRRKDEEFPTQNIALITFDAGLTNREVKRILNAVAMIKGVRDTRAGRVIVHNKTRAIWTVMRAKRKPDNGKVDPRSPGLFGPIELNEKEIRVEKEKS